MLLCTLVISYTQTLKLVSGEINVKKRKEKKKKKKKKKQQYQLYPH